MELESDTATPLGCHLLVEFDDGSAEKIWADFDTRCDCDVIDAKLAEKWAATHKLQWGKSGGEYLVMGGGSVKPKGTLHLDCSIAGREVRHRLPRRLRLGLTCEIMEAPAGIVLGLNTLQSTGLLKAVLEDSDGPAFPDLVEEDGVEDWGDEIPTEVTWPTLKGPASFQHEIMEILRPFADVFGPPPKGGSELPPLHIEKLPGAFEDNAAGERSTYRPARARPVSPAVLQDIRDYFELLTDNGWLQKGNGRYASALVAAKQPGKPKRRICGDFRLINKLTRNIAYP